jgi:PAS domain S-box-containing protein
MDQTNHRHEDTVLRQWRTRILNGFLFVATVIAALMTVATILDVRSSPELWHAVSVYLVLVAMLAVLAIFRQIAYPIRAWGLLIVCELAGLSAMATFGLGSAGRLYLLAVPILALILIGERPAMIMSGISAIIYASFAIMADTGLLSQLLVRDRDSLLVADWLAELSDTLGVLTAVMVLLLLSWRFQQRMIDSERHAQTQLIRAQRLLEEQNVTLEQKAQEHLAELLVIDDVQKALASKLDVDAIYELIGEKVREVFNVDCVDIVSFDADANLISMPYSYEKGDRSVITPRPPYGFRLEVIDTREPLLINRDFAEVAVQHGNPILTGQCPKSALFVPLLVEDRVTYIISIQNLERENAFKESDVRVLQTLAIAMSIALESARLFTQVEGEKKLSETLIRTSPVAIVTLDQGNTVTTWNPAAERLFGYVQAEALGNSIVELVTDREMRTEALDVAHRMSQGESVHTLTRRLTKDGREVDVELFAVPVVLDEKRVGTFAMYHDITELMRAEAAIEESQRRLADIIDFLPDATLVIDDEDRVIAWNRAIEEMTGVRAEEMIGKGNYEYALPFYGERRPILIDLVRLPRREVEQNYSHLQWAGNTLTGESYTPALKDGARYLYATASRLRNADGGFGGAIETIRDITDRKQAETQLRESNEKLRLIFENAFDGISIYEERPGEDRRVLVDCNERYCEIAGRSKEELLAIGDTRVIQRSIENAPNQEDEASVLAGQAFSGLFSWIRPDGKDNVVEYNAAPTRVGDRYYTIGLDRDVTERRRVEDALRESNEKLRLIFENAFDGISIYEEIPIEEQRRLVECNERYCEMAGRSREELLAIEDTRAVQIDLGADQERFDFEPITSERAFSGVFTWLRPDGKENIIEYNAAPTRVGGHYFTIGMDRDVTERRHQQAELERARAAAEQANQAKSAFLANMSHELRTPLNAIIGFTRIVRRKGEGALPEKQVENLDKVLISADHLLNLINTVLDIAKIEAGRMDVLAANFRIATLVDLCANTAQPLLKPTVVLQKQVDERLTYVYSDQDKIRQILLNLLSNAAKFTHEGTIVLTARADGDKVRVSVSDTGIGISAEALPRIFKEFQQADNATTRQYGGTGLGLSISRNLARLLGGDLTVDSELGKGSTFTLVIPTHYESRLATSYTEPESAPGRVPAATIDPAGASPVRTAPAEASPPNSQPGAAKPRVLVIDDDLDAVYFVRENLSPQEFEIIGARSGREGIDVARHLQPQAILLDVVMPEADGWQVLNDLKANPATANIPVIFLTIIDKKALGLKLGAADYLLKPLDPLAVRSTLNRVIRGSVPSPKRVLVVDDDPNVAHMLRQFLPEADFSLESALDGVVGLQAIEKSRPDILLLDLLMPCLDGFGVIERLRADPQTRGLPIVVITAKDLTESEAARLKETVRAVMRKRGFEGEKLVEEINNALKHERISP